jgi:HlyD family secretion protein
MVDLDRLKIPDERPARRGGAWKVAMLCIVCLGAGFGASELVGHWKSPGVARVQVMVVRPAGAEGGKSFTAGGWIEATTPAYPIVVSCRISERLEELRIHEGQEVPPGQVIARLYDRDVRSRLAAARARQAAAAKALEKLEAGYRKEDVEAAEAKVTSAAEALRIARANYERSKGLKPGSISKEQLDNELSVFRKAEAAHAEAQAEAKKMQAGYRVEDVAVARADVAEADSLVQLAEQELSYCTIAAPDVGRPLRVLKLFHKVGAWIDARREPALAWLYDPKDMQVRVDVRQNDIRSVAVGGEASVVTEAHPRKPYKGKVLRIEPLAELAKNTVTVRVRIEDPDALLFPEMVAQVTFSAPPDEPGAKARRGLWVPAAAVLGQGAGRHVFISRDGVARRQDVTVSETAGSRVLIGAGLQSGQRVIVSGLDTLRDGQKIEEE